MNSSKKIMNKQNGESVKESSQVSAAKGNKRLSDGGFSDTKKIVIGAICHYCAGSLHRCRYPAVSAKGCIKGQ